MIFTESVMKTLYKAALSEYKQFQNYQNNCQRWNIQDKLENEIRTEDELIQEFQTNGVRNITDLIEAKFAKCQNNLEIQRKKSEKKLHENIEKQWPIIKKMYNEHFKKLYFEIIKSEHRMNHNKFNLNNNFPNQKDIDLHNGKYQQDNNILRYFSFKLNFGKTIFDYNFEGFDNKNWIIYVNDNKTTDTLFYKYLIYFTRSLSFHYYVQNTKPNRDTRYYYYPYIIDGTKIYLKPIDFKNNTAHLNIILDRKTLD